jgi:hypothetical protein
MVAEVPGGLETLAGGTVTGMLVALMAILMRRTKDVDERRDEGTRMLIDGLHEQTERAWLERDAALNRVTELEAIRDVALKRVAELEALLRKAGEPYRRNES